MMNRSLPKVWFRVRVLSLAYLSFSGSIAQFLWINSSAFAGVHSMDQDVPWRDFKQKHGKHYGSVQEEQERYRIYKDNLAKIEQLNDENEKINGNRPFGVNEFTDLDPAEFAKGYLTYNQAKDTREIEPPSQKTFVSSASLPSQVDWSQKGACTPVKNQGNCGSCWAFSAIEELESATFMSTGNLPLLSAQQVTSCSTADNGCGGGDTVSAYSYMIRAGVQSDASYPYTSGSTGSTGSCRYDSTSVTARMTGWQYGIPGCSSRDPSCASQAASEPQLMQVVSAQGPASVCLNATPWQYYTGGVMASNCASDYYSMNHCVQLVGYGTSTDGSQYWILRNQWGTSWGNGGFISLKMGSNLCGLANEVTYVTGVSSSGPSPAPTPTPTPTPTYSPTPTPTPTPIQQAVLQVYTSQSVYSRGSTVKITTRVLSSTGTGVFGAKVIVTLRKPNGVTLQGSATTGSTGTIVFGYFLQQSDPLGTYSIQASSSVNGASLSSSTSFKVQ